MNPFCAPEHPAPQWQWLTLAGQPYLTCDLLADWPHGFFTQQFYPTPPETISERLAPEAAAYRVKQVHGNVALTPTAIAAHPGEELPLADGVVTEAPQQAAWVASADCTPVLIGDIVTGRVAALHSGWRGTAQRIVPQTITQLLAMGSQLKNLRLAMGPAIQGQVYQVGEQVGQEVARSMVAEPDPETNYLQQAMALDEPALFPDEHPGRVRLDVRRVIALQLQDIGVATQNVAIAPCCTYQQPNLFFSYRRTKEKKVQWSGIVGQ